MNNTSCQSFPQRVYNVLKLCEEQGREDVISWENDGTAFKVNNLREFERDLLPKYFKTKKYNTFTRALYSYGFTCFRTGRQPGIYSHPSFNRNDPLGVYLMKRVPRKTKTPTHAHSNAFLDALNRRQSDRRRPGILHGQPSNKFPSLLGETAGVQEDDDTATVFGRSYHTPLGSQGGGRAISLPTSVPPTSATGASLSMFGTKGDRMNARSSIPTPSTSNLVANQTSFSDAASSNVTANDPQVQAKPSISLSDGLLLLGSDRVTPVVSSSGVSMRGSEQLSTMSLIPRYDPGGSTHRLSGLHNHGFASRHKAGEQPSTYYLNHASLPTDEDPRSDSLNKFNNLK